MLSLVLRIHTLAYCVLTSCIDKQNLSLTMVWLKWSHISFLMRHPAGGAISSQTFWLWEGPSYTAYASRQNSNIWNHITTSAECTDMSFCHRCPKWDCRTRAVKICHRSWHQFNSCDVFQVLGAPPAIRCCPPWCSSQSSWFLPLGIICCYFFFCEDNSSQKSPGTSERSQRVCLSCPSLSYWALWTRTSVPFRDLWKYLPGL